MTEPQSPPCCGSCACYQPDPVQLLMGVCRRLPPAPVFANQGGVIVLMSVSPPVPAGGYCHQWRPLPGVSEASSDSFPAPQL